MTALSIGLANPARDDATPGAAAWLAAASFATLTQALIVPGLLPGLAGGLAVGVAEAGQATTVFALGAALAALPAARLCRRLPQQRLIAAALAGLAALGLAAALATSLALLLALRAASGVLAGVVLPAAPALAVALAGPDGRVRALAAVTAGSTLAFAAGLPATSLVAGTLGWRAAFVLAGLFSAAAALALALRLPAAPAIAPAAGPGRAAAAPAAPWAIAQALLLVLLAFTSVFATQAFLGPIAERTLHASPATLQALIAAGALLGVPSGVALAVRLDERAVGVIAGGLLAAALWQWGLLAGGLQSPLLQAGQIVAASAGLFAISPLLQARLLAAAGRAGTTAMAANFVAVSLGQALGAALGGLALGRGGLAGAAAIGVMAAGLMLILAVQRAR